MSWLKKLHETYENCAGRIGRLETIGKKGKQTCLLPIFHTTQNAQIEITIDLEGRFKRAAIIPKNEASTIIPCTEESGGRTSGPVPHPLCDKLQYIAGDYHYFAGNGTDSLHKAYLQGLSDWCSSSYTHPKVEAVYAYVKNRTTIADLCKVGILQLDPNTNTIVSKWNNLQVEVPLIFKVMPNKTNPLEAFIRWSVEDKGIPQTALSTDLTIWKSWEQFYSSTQKTFGFCYVTATSVPIVKNHPAKLRNAGDKAKLISANDKSGFTYRGRFSDPDGRQVCGIGFEVSQKAHNALRWLTARQGYLDDSLVILAWSTRGLAIPDPLADSRALFESDNFETKDDLVSSADTFYTAEDFAFRLNKKISGYAANLGNAHNIIILGLDSATPGRLSVIYYRELTASDFLNQVEMWHTDCSWLQNYGKNFHFIGAPSPRDIAEMAFGKKVNEAGRKRIVRQLLPCILENAPIPQYLLDNCVRRASNRHSIEDGEWEKALGIACALFRKYYKHKRIYQMYLELDYVSRDYLYGRLLAIAEHIERSALKPDEKRMANAARLMQRFANHPYTTWREICIALQPYKTRLLSSKPGLLFKLEKELDTVTTAFTPHTFTAPDKLSGEFLLGYHCQRLALRTKPEQMDSEVSIDESNVN